MVFLSVFSLISYSEELRNDDKIKSEDIKKGKKILNEMKKELNESLELKVLRSGSNLENQIVASEEAFKIGFDRMTFLKNEEEQLLALEEGIHEKSNTKLLYGEFEETYENFNKVKENADKLMAEDKQLKEYLNNLNQMERKLKN